MIMTKSIIRFTKIAIVTTWVFLKRGQPTPESQLTGDNFLVDLRFCLLLLTTLVSSSIISSAGHLLTVYG